MRSIDFLLCFTSFYFPFLFFSFFFLFFPRAYEGERERERETVMELKLRLDHMYSCPQYQTKIELLCFFLL